MVDTSSVQQSISLFAVGFRFTKKYRVPRVTKTTFARVIHWKRVGLWKFHSTVSVASFWTFDTAVAKICSVIRSYRGGNSSLNELTFVFRCRNSWSSILPSFRPSRCNQRHRAQLVWTVNLFEMGDHQCSWLNKSFLPRNEQICKICTLNILSFYQITLLIALSPFVKIAKIILFKDQPCYLSHMTCDHFVQSCDTDLGLFLHKPTSNFA